MIEFLILWAVVSAVYILFTLPELLDHPYKNQAERVEKVIMYIEAEPETTYSKGKTKEQVIATVLHDRGLLRYYERLAVANQLLDKHDPERLRLRIAELEQQLGINDEATEPSSMGKRSSLTGRSARSAG